METILQKKLSIDKTKWTAVKFGEVVFEPKESSKDLVADGIKHVVGLEHIESENIHLRKSETLEESTTFTKKFAIGDVLFGRRRAYLRKASQASFSGICSGDITVFRAKENLMPELLPFVVNNEKFFDYAIKHSAGGLSPRVKFKDLANYEFLLPPKDQQAQLSKLLWAMDEVIEKEKEVLRSVEQSYLVKIEKELLNKNSEKTYFKDLGKIIRGVGYKPNDLVLTEINPRDTVGDAVFTKINIVKKKSLNNLLIVTSDYHVLRVHKIFSYIYGEQYTIKVLGSKTNKEMKLLGQEKKSLKQFNKTFNDIKSGNDDLIYQRLCSEHPYYNGDIYPKI